MIREYIPAYNKIGEKPSFRFIGDIHGNFNYFKKQLCSPNLVNVQVGDHGIGFEGYEKPVYPDNIKFLRGNHDNPEKCKEHPNYLGDFGYNDDFFYISGAYSIDQIHRIPGISWWRKEELTIQQQNECLDLYEKIKPDVLITHQCSKSIQDQLFKLYPYPNITERFLDEILRIHTPKLWIFGHYHMSRDQVIDDCRYICLSEFEVLDIKLADYTQST